MSIAEKKECIDSSHPRLSILRQCELVELPRSTYYRESSEGQESSENLELMVLIDELYTAYPFYGSRQMHNALRRNGLKINRKRVQRLMRKMGLQSIAPKPDTSNPICSIKCIRTGCAALISIAPIRSGAAISLISGYPEDLCILLLSWTGTVAMYYPKNCQSPWKMSSVFLLLNGPCVFMADQKFLIRIRARNIPAMNLPES